MQTCSSFIVWYTPVFPFCSRTESFCCDSSITNISISHLLALHIGKLWDWEQNVRGCLGCFVPGTSSQTLAFAGQSGNTVWEKNPHTPGAAKKKHQVLPTAPVWGKSMAGSEGTRGKRNTSCHLTLLEPLNVSCCWDTAAFDKLHST